MIPFCRITGCPSKVWRGFSVVERERSIPDASPGFRMEKNSVPDEVKKFIRAVLLSEQGGVPVRRLCTDYRNLIGHVLDWRGLGFTRLEDFVKAMPDVCRLEAFGPEKELRVYGIGDPDSFMSSFAIKAQTVTGPPKKTRNRDKRKGQKSSSAEKGSPMGSTCNGKRSPECKAESPTQQYPVHELVVTQLTRDTTEEEILTLFAPFDVANVRVKKQGGEEYGSSTMEQMMHECSGDQGVNTAPTPAASYPQELSVIVTEVVDGCHFWGQVNQEGKNNLLELQELQKGLNQLCPAPPLPPGDKTGAAPFEGEWYRVWIQEELPEDQLQVVFVDYGNSAVLPRTEVSPLLIPQFWDLPPQAVPFKLAGLSSATSNGHDKLKGILSWQVVSVKQSQSRTCEPHILEVEVYIPDATDSTSVNSMLKRETCEEGHSFPQKTVKGVTQEEPNCYPNISTSMPTVEDRTREHSISRQRAEKATTRKTGAMGDIFSNSTTLNQERKHSSEQKEAGRKFDNETFQQKSGERSHQKFQSPFLSEKEEAALRRISEDNTEMGRRHQETPVGQQQRLMGGQHSTVQHQQGLLGTPINKYAPQLLFKGKRFALLAKVSEVVTPDRFYIQSADSPLLNKVSQSLQEAANKRTAQELSDLRTLCYETGQVMCTYSEKHHMWRRVRIDGILPDMINVQHVDYGTMELTQLHNLFPLPPDILSVPILARPACLANTAPLPKDGHWTEGANAFLKGLTANKVLFAEVTGEQAGDKLLVTLWSSMDKKNNLSQQLMDQNYAIYSQPLPISQLPAQNPSFTQGKPLPVLLPTPQPPQISNQPFFDQQPHLPIPQYPLFTPHVPYQHPRPKHRMKVGERFSLLGNQKTPAPSLGGEGAFKIIVRAEEGKERTTSGGEKIEPPTGQSSDSAQGRYVKDHNYGATDMNGNKGPSFATVQPSKLVSHNVRSTGKQYHPGNSNRASRNSGNKFGKGGSPLSLGAQRNILHQIVGDVQETSNKSQPNCESGPANKVEMERRDSGVSNISTELENRLQQLVQVDTGEGRENAENCTPTSEGLPTNQHQKGLLESEFKGCLPTTSGMSAVDILTSQLIELHTEE
uniref:HTH OST-type domain-containing protein n=1 Tax=Branchiostoma floridae TaxID=7739 RepID=C3ZKS5_BRAFL|eukprot:XP_002590816.1 hypothetical protein BRAFLDRAFT_125731 [Branchiostoma floridae]